MLFIILQVKALKKVLVFSIKMIFPEYLTLVFLILVIKVRLNESTTLQSLNRTLFLFNSPSSCNSREIYNLDFFMCVSCEEKVHLIPSLDKLTCDCDRNSTKVALYDSLKKQPICSTPCKNKGNLKCSNTTLLPSPESPCTLNFINYTTSEDRSSASKKIRISPPSLSDEIDCRCNLKYNYIYKDFCIWIPLLKNYLNHNAFWKQGKIHEDLKFIAFFCQSLHNIAACNNLANLCIQSFFDTDKNSPCSVFLLAQASDAALYAGIGEKLDGLRPFLFYKKGKETVQEISEHLKVSKDNLNLFSTIYSLEGRLIQWENFQLNKINPCGYDFENLHRDFQFFRNYEVSCDLRLEAIIDMALTHGNKYYTSIFLNHTGDDGKSYLQTIPVLIENAFEGNNEPNPVDWQLVKRFSTITTQIQYSSTPNLEVLNFEDTYKLRLFKSIRFLRKFELRCTVTQDSRISVPVIVLNYHIIDISPNTTLNEVYNFEFKIKFEMEDSSGLLYEIALSVFIGTSLISAVFRSYIFKCRRNLEYFEIVVFFEGLYIFASNLANSFLAIVLLDVFYSVTVFLVHNDQLLMPSAKKYMFESFIYSALLLKSCYFFIKFWRLSKADIFFIDWERPKNTEATLNLRNNIETLSQCSSIRTLTDNNSNVSAWRTIFLANEWIDLSCKQKSSTLIQAVASLIAFWIATSNLPSINLNSILRIFTCVLIYSSVELLQCICKYFIINHVFGNPMKKFLDICTLANVSIYALIDCSFGFYIHGRSPHGFSDTDMSSMIFQLQRESQSMCGKKGLLSDSDFQTYIVLPPLNLRKHIEKLLPFKKNSASQSLLQKDRSMNMEGLLERSSATNNRINRFFCAFIDHAIKDMDYIIKERSFAEHLLSCEFESFVAEQKGTFYIDDSENFGTLFLYGNHFEIFLMNLLILLSMNLLTANFIMSIIVVGIFYKVFQMAFRVAVKNNISIKTLIDKRFLT